MVIAETLTEILRQSDPRAVREALARLAPQLSIEDGLALELDRNASDPAEADFARTGVTEMRDLVDASTCARLVQGIGALVAAQVPAVFVYVFDEPWRIGDALRARFPGYALAEDAWAFHVTPGRAGWSAHRGVAHAHLDRARPEIVNAWIALSDAAIDRSCMHLVELDDDPGYPDRLDSIAIASGKARALPVPAGTALAWNANVLHWGGPCEPTAAGPRTSCTFTLVREDAKARFGAHAMRPGAPPFAERLDLVAGQIVTYGAGQPEISPEILDWARAARALRAISAP